MFKNIKRLFMDCFRHLGKQVLFRSKDKSYLVQILKQQPDKLYGIGEGQFVGEMLMLEVSVFDVLQPMVGDIFAIGDRKYKIHLPPLRASKRNDIRKMHNLQKLLLTSKRAKLLAVS